MEEFIVITNGSNKKNILKKLSENKLLYNIKFYTFKELKKQIFFDYNNEALEYIMAKYKVSFNIAKIYIENLYYLREIDDEKVKFLINLKKELEENNLLIKNSLFKDYILKKKVIVYGYKILKKKEQIILDNLGVDYEIKNEVINQYKHVVYEAEDINKEVEFVVSKISELLEQKVLINKIKLIMSDEYISVVKRYFQIFNIPLNLEDNGSFYSTMVAQEFLNNYNNLEIEDNILQLKDKYENINDLITIINKSVLVKDKEIRKEFIINDLKQTKIKGKIYDKAVEKRNLNDYFTSQDYVFLLGFNLNNIPKVIKDEDYLRDTIKDELGIDTSIEENKIEKLNTIESLEKIKNLTISYRLSSRSGKCYPSLLIKEMGMEVKKIKQDITKSYAILNSKLEYAKCLDNLYKFNIIDEEMGIYQNNLNIKYREYDNMFTGINKDKYIASLDKGIVLAYTNMEMYNECSFRYYLSKVLKIDIYEENFKAIIGTISHHILELALKRDINIEAEIMLFVKEKDYKLGAKELFYLEKLSRELQEVINILKMQEKHSKLTNYLFEEELYVYQDRKDVKVTFKGLIDKVMYTTFKKSKVIAVVDYKTGEAKVKLDNLEYGLNLQLPIYLYLLKKSDKFKEAIIGGFYIQKVLNGVAKISKKTKEEMAIDNLRLQGYSNRDTNILELIDDNYLSGKILKDVKYNKDGSLSKNAKVLSNGEMEDLTVKVEEKINDCVDNIIDANFVINPKVLGKNNISCMYCKFRDICYVSKKDEVRIGGEDDEFDGGTEEGSLS